MRPLGPEQWSVVDPALLREESGASQGYNKFSNEGEGDRELEFVIRDVNSQLFWTKSMIVGTRLLVRLCGSLDMDTTPLLKSYLEPLLRDIQAGIVSEFEVDVRELYLMSSSSISCFATWTKSLKSLQNHCKVVFLTNPALGWQRRAIDPICNLAPQLVSVD